MNKQLLYFENLCNQLKKSLSLEDTNKDIETEISVTLNDEPVDDSKITVNNETETETTNSEETVESVNIDNVNIDNITINVNIKNLKIKLLSKLDDIKKKAYASKLYSTNVGNNPAALKDYGYFIGQKELLYEILKDLSELEKTLTISEQEEE